MKKSLVIILAVLALSACTTYGSESAQLSQEELNNSVVIGKSTEQDVLLKFGSANSKEETTTGKAWIYSGWKSTPIGNIDGKFVVAFNKQGIVTAINKVK